MGDPPTKGANIGFSQISSLYSHAYRGTPGNDYYIEGVDRYVAAQL
jgi:hypothetical protein